MKIIFATTADLTGWLLLAAIVPRFVGNEIAIALAHRRRPVDRQGLLQCLWSLERTQPQRLWRRENRLSRSPFHALAAQYQAPVTVYRHARQWQQGAALGVFPPDLLLTLRFGWRLGAAALAAIPAAYNIHPGRLPDYAGQYPVLWALLDGVATLHCTVHRLTPTLDGGPIIAVGTQAVLPHASHFWLRYHTYLAGFEAWWTATHGGTAQPTAIAPASSPPLRGWPESADFLQLRQQGHSLMSRDDYGAALTKWGLSPAQAAQLSNGIPPTIRKNFGLLD